MHFLGRWHCLVQIPAEIVLIYLAELILDQVPIYWLEVVQKSKHLLLFLQLEPRNSLCNVAKLFNNSSFAKSCNNCRCSSAGMGRNPLGAGALGEKGFAWKEGNVVPGRGCCLAEVRGAQGYWGFIKGVRLERHQSWFRVSWLQVSFSVVLCHLLSN